MYSTKVIIMLIQNHPLRIIQIDTIYKTFLIFFLNRKTFIFIFISSMKNCFNIICKLTWIYIYIFKYMQYIIIRKIYLCLHYYTYTLSHSWAKVLGGVSNEVVYLYTFFYCTIKTCEQNRLLGYKKQYTV